MNDSVSPWSTRLENGRIRCDICPRYCILRDGQRGLCFVRKNHGGKLILTTYGRSSGFCIDPIEKKPLYHFYPGSSVLSFGTAGCNLTCKFCQNWDMSKARQMDILQNSATPEQIAVSAENLNALSVAFTYNDPVIFMEYATDTADECRKRGLKTVVVTAGYINPEPAVDFFSRMDGVNVDLKSFSDDFYRKLCGARLQPVLDVLKYLIKETSVWVEITTLIIPGENDSEKEIGQLCQWVGEELGEEVPLHFSAFHPDYKMSSLPHTSPHTILDAVNIAGKQGLKYVYPGNIRSMDGGNTKCPNCSITVISRMGYEVTDYRIRGGECPDCGQIIPGRFDEKPGRWGSRYQRVTIH